MRVICIAYRSQDDDITLGLAGSTRLDMKPPDSGAWGCGDVSGGMRVVIEGHGVRTRTALGGASSSVSGACAAREVPDCRTRELVGHVNALAVCPSRHDERGEMGE